MLKNQLITGKFSLCASIVLLGLTLCLTNTNANAQASVTGSKTAPEKWSTPVFTSSKLGFNSGWFLGLGVSKPAFSLPGTTYLYTSGLSNSPVGYNTTAVKPTPVYEVSTGYQLANQSFSPWLPAHRLSLLYQNLSTTASGGFLDLSPFWIYSLQNKIQANSFFVDWQTDLVNYKGFAPYLEAGLGASINQFSNYNATFISGVYRPQVQFPNRQTLAFAWRLGSGLGYHFKIHEHETVLSFSYTYADKGLVQTGSGNLDPANRGPGGALKGVALRGSEIGVNLRFVL
jgi:hypothetical protein